MEHSPFISLITATLNASKTLRGCIESIAQQTYPNFEHLIIDGYSTDNTMEIVKEYAQKYPHIKYISEKDKGIYDAMNKGIEMAQGEWIYFLGADDRLFDDSVLMRIFDGHRKYMVEEADFVYANVLLGDTGTVYDGIFDVIKLYNNNICHQCIFVKRNVFDKKGIFSLKYPVLADYYFNLLCFTDDSIRKEYLNIIIAYFALNGASGAVKDPFENEKFDLFKKNLKNVSFETLLRFRIIYADKSSIVGKINYIINNILLDILTTYITRKLRKIIYMLRSKFHFF
jgi:glycosyltransferase involved in cell wall biosynthesis